MWATPAVSAARRLAPASSARTLERHHERRATPCIERRHPCALGRSAVRSRNGASGSLGSLSRPAAGSRSRRAHKGARERRRGRADRPMPVLPRKPPRRSRSLSRCRRTPDRPALLDESAPPHCCRATTFQQEAHEGSLCSRQNLAGRNPEMAESYKQARRMARRALIAAAESTNGSRDSGRGGDASRKAVLSVTPNHRRYPSA